MLNYIEIKLVDEHATIPSKGSEHAVGYDMTCINVNHTQKYIEYDTGVAMAIPLGYVGLLLPRSSVTKMDLMLKNSVGVIDPDYRGTIRFRYYQTTDSDETYNFGDKVGQIVFVPILTLDGFKIVGDLSETVRGIGGFGSTGV